LKTSLKSSWSVAPSHARARSLGAVLLEELLLLVLPCAGTGRRHPLRAVALARLYVEAAQRYQVFMCTAIWPKSATLTRWRLVAVAHERAVLRESQRGLERDAAG
jgi:hypothetical protein